ncbi:T-cell receptor beta chain V region YT35 [Sciurus carolinensis]|nr:T-cell receptor beta chain V region YT35 [Sciurus carolinensis]
MVTKILCYVVLCFLGGEPTYAGVTQTPRHKVTQKGQTITLRCEPKSDHDTLFWYRQTVVQGLKLLVYFNNKALVNDAGMPKDRFSAAMPEASFSTLKIRPIEPEDSALYLCASSSDTALQNPPVQVQKPCCFLFSNSQPLSVVAPGCSPISGRTRV